MMAGKAFVFQNGKYLTVEIDSAGQAVVDLVGKFGDSSVKKMVDGIFSRESF